MPQRGKRRFETFADRVETLLINHQECVAKLAYSPPGIIVSPLANSSETNTITDVAVAYQCRLLANVVKLTQVTIDACFTYFIVVNSEVTGPKFTKFYLM